MDKENMKKILVVDYDARVKAKEVVNQYAYYLMIAIISILATFIPPLLLGAIGGEISLNFPSTVDGWVLWVMINGSTALANISLLILFKLQAKKNSKGNENYLKACLILEKLNDEKVLHIPRSPEKKNRQDYSKKIVFIVLGTLGSFIAVTSLILNFDIYTLISTLISVTITIVLSWFTMLDDEEYWTNEFLLYAKYKEQQVKELEKSRESTEEVEEGEENA